MNQKGFQFDAGEHPRRNGIQRRPHTKVRRTFRPTISRGRLGELARERTIAACFQVGQRSHLAIRISIRRDSLPRTAAANRLFHRVYATC